MRNLVVVAAALGGLYLMAKRSAAVPRPLPPRPPTELEYHNHLAHLLEAAASYGDKEMWERVSGKCHEADRDDLPIHVRRQWPEFAERLDRA